jgi:DNA-binding transcriptional ArsR family regulator
MLKVSMRSVSQASVRTEAFVVHAAPMNAAQLIAEPARAAMLDALMDGESRAAGDLARRAGVAPSTASEHLGLLAAGGLLVVEPSGRERRYRLASADVADALEALARIDTETPVRSLRASNRMDALRLARTCYDHLAGRLGVAVTEALVESGALVLRDTSFDVADERSFTEIGVDVDAAHASRRAFARACTDWTERRPHLAGALGAAVADAMLAGDWVRRRPNDRGLIVTPRGALALERTLGVELAADGA